jgi:hypothetical protein
MFKPPRRSGGQPVFSATMSKVGYTIDRAVYGIPIYKLVTPLIWPVCIVMIFQF